uniref:glutathione transferase n=1 Tax=Wollemia nobilis TaxID=56998 RepID=A0A0C9RQM6_9CONI
MARQEEVKVLNAWASMFGMRVLVGLEEKGVKYDYQEENLGNRSELVLQMNPVYKKIPVLIHNGKPVCESLIIVQYIDEAWPSKPFMSSNPYARALERFWADFVDNKFYDAGFRILKSKGEAQEEAKRDMVEYLELLEGALKDMSGGGPYFGGQEFGFMDIAFIPFTCWFHSYETIGDFTIPFDTRFPCLLAWIEKCMERESVKKILPPPDKVLGHASQFRKRFVTD